MKRNVLLIWLLMACIGLSAQPVGFASINGVTDGGRGENPVVVTNFQEFKKLFHKGDSTRQTIYVKGRIDFPGLFRVKEVKNKSIIGLKGSALANDKYTTERDSSGTLALVDCENIIVQNITFLGPGAFDRDANDNLLVSRSTHIWIDHCDFQDGMDGNFDTNLGTDWMTVSWCRFRYLKNPWPKLADDENDDHNSDHRFSNLMGSSDRDVRCEGKLRTTFDHCWWDEGCRMRMPFVRFGKVHVLNCLYASSVAVVYIQARYKSNVLVEASAFVKKPKKNSIFQTPGMNRPQYRDYNIRFRNSLGAKDLEQRYGDADYFTPPYQYQVQSAADVEKTVRQQAGATLDIQIP